MTDKNGNKEEYAFYMTNGDWRVTGDYKGEGNIVFYHKGEIHKILTVPGYKIWNVAAHFGDIIADFESGMAIAMSNGLGGGTPFREEQTNDNGK